MKQSVIFGAIAFVLVCTVGFVGEWVHEGSVYEVRARDSVVQFTVTKWAVFKVEGRFSSFEGAIRYDHEDPSRTEVDFVVDIASVSTGDRDRDRRVQAEDFFDTARFPQMAFKSTRVEVMEEGLLHVTGDMTIRDVTRRITVPVHVLGFNTVENEGALAGFETTFTLDRMDYGVHGWRRNVGHEVKVYLAISANAVP